MEAALRRGYLWEEIKDRLRADARSLSGGQQQRPCMARALVIDSEVLLLDEPTASLDGKATAIIEALIRSLRQTCIIVMVSHDTAPVARIADRWLILCAGKIMPAAGKPVSQWFSAV